MPCKDISLSELQEILKNLEGYRKTLLTQQIAERKHLLCVIGQYLLQTRPSKLDGSYIVRIEVFLNDLAQYADSWNWPPFDEIDDCVGLAGALAEIFDNIDDLKRHHHPDLGKYAKQLGRKLKYIGGS